VIKCYIGHPFHAFYYGKITAFVIECNSALHNDVTIISH
jgi:hypothetical protein